MRQHPTRLALEPLRSFVLLGALCALLGASLLALVVYQRLTGDDEGLYGRPVSLLAVTLLVFGVQIAGLGLVSEILVRFIDWWRRTGSN